MERLEAVLSTRYIPQTWTHGLSTLPRRLANRAGAFLQLAIPASDLSLRLFRRASIFRNIIGSHAFTELSCAWISNEISFPLIWSEIRPPPCRIAAISILHVKIVRVLLRIKERQMVAHPIELRCCCLCFCWSKRIQGGELTVGILECTAVLPSRLVAKRCPSPFQHDLNRFLD